jgi:hypothetical protein
MSEATKPSGTALNSAAGPKGEGQDARSHRTATAGPKGGGQDARSHRTVNAVQCALLIAPYRLPGPWGADGLIDSA